MRYAPRIANATASRDVTGMPSWSLVRTASGATAARNAFSSVGFCAPPPATMSSRQVTPAGVSRLSASATVRAVSAIAVASASSRVPPFRVTRRSSSSANACPKSSRPVLFGGRFAKYSLAKAQPSARSSTRPRAAPAPLSS